MWEVLGLILGKEEKLHVIYICSLNKIEKGRRGRIREKIANYIRCKSLSYIFTKRVNRAIM